MSARDDSAVRPARSRRQRSGEAGFTLVEVLVAIVLLATGALAVMQVFDTSIRNNYRANESQVMINRAQRELEAIRDLDYKEVALTAMPTSARDAKDPRSRVLGGSFALNRDGTNPAELVVNGAPGVDAGVMDPGPEPFTDGDISGEIYRFVVWQNDPKCLPVQCPGTHDLKRVVVAVKLDTAAVSFERAYQETQSDFVNPKASAVSDSVPDQGEPVTAQQFWLSDTTCDNASRQATSADHLVHNTLGVCADGGTTSTSIGAPDTLFDTAPPDPAVGDPLNPSLFDFATNPELEPSPNTDKGLQLKRQAQSGCDYTPSGPTKHMEAHRWVSEPLPVRFAMTGDASLELFTRTTNDASVSGTICIYVFIRSEAGSGVTDTLFTNLGSPSDTFWLYSDSAWPRDAWSRVSIPLRFAPATVQAGDRVGVALTIERAGTPVNALQFLYDHPQFDSRLEIQTTTPFGG